MGATLGIGASPRDLRKSRAVVSTLAAPGSPGPMGMLHHLSADIEMLGITALHIFTFTHVAHSVRTAAARGVDAHNDVAWQTCRRGHSYRRWRGRHDRRGFSGCRQFLSARRSAHQQLRHHAAKTSASHSTPINRWLSEREIRVYRVTLSF